MKTISIWSALGMALVLGTIVGCGSPTSTGNVANAPPITTCGYGTVASGGQCVTQSAPSGGSGGCAAGYTSSNGTCVPSH